MDVARLNTLAKNAVRRLQGRLPEGVTPEDALNDAIVVILKWEGEPPPEGVPQDAFLVMKAWGTLKDQYGREWKKNYALNRAPREAPKKPSDEPDGPVPINPVAPLPPVTSGIQEDDLPVRQTQMDVRDAIARLDARGQKIMTLVLEGHTHQEIADKMGLSQPWVSRLVREAQETLKTYLESYA